MDNPSKTGRLARLCTKVAQNGISPSRKQVGPCKGRATGREQGESYEGEQALERLYRLSEYTRFAKLTGNALEKGSILAEIAL
jgi:hypothetical protein